MMLESSSSPSDHSLEHATMVDWVGSSIATKPLTKKAQRGLPLLGAFPLKSLTFERWWTRYVQMSQYHAPQGHLYGGDALYWLVLLPAIDANRHFIANTEGIHVFRYELNQEPKHGWMSEDHYPGANLVLSMVQDLWEWRRVGFRGSRVGVLTEQQCNDFIALWNYVASQQKTVSDLNPASNRWSAY